MRFAAALAAVIISSPAIASEETFGQYWAKWGPQAQAASSVSLRAAPRVAGRDPVRAIVAAEASRQLGAQWVPVALRIAHVESRFNPGAVGPRTRHGRAQGVMQVMPGTARALGYNPARLREAHYGAAAGVAHMRACIASGVRNERQMAACHVAGVAGWKRRLARGHERYKQSYVRMVMR